MMRWNFTKNKLAVKRTSLSSSLRWYLLAIISVCVLSSAIYLFFHFQNPQSMNDTGYFASVSEWIATRPCAVAENMMEKPSKKMIVSNHLTFDNAGSHSLTRDDGDNADPSVHFEFYSTLPTAQVAPEQTKKVKFMQAEELEQQLASKLRQEKYILQIGMFHTLEAAVRYRKVLSHAGWKVSISKFIEGDHKVYRIQQGPFNDVKVAKLAQKKLQKRGIVSLIRKIDQG